MKVVKANFSVVYTESKKEINEIIKFTEVSFSNFFSDSELKIISNINESNLKDFGVSLCFFYNYYNEIYTGMDFFELKYPHDTAEILSDKAEKLGYVLNVDVQVENIFSYKFALYFIYSLCYFSKGIISVNTYYPNSLNLYDIYTLNEWMDFIREKGINPIT